MPGRSMNTLMIDEGKSCRVTLTPPKNMTNKEAEVCLTYRFLKGTVDVYIISTYFFLVLLAFGGAFLGSLHPSWYFMTRLLYAVPVPQQAYATTKHK